MRLMFVVNVDWFFVSHRLPIAKEAIRQGHEVHIATTVTDRLEILEQSGLVVHPVRVGRSESGPLAALRLTYELVRLFRSIRPDLVHLITIKPILFGGIAARIASVPTVVAAVSGLGFVFVSTGWLARLRRQAVALLYRVALSHRRLMVIFQNDQDAELITRMARLQPDQTTLIPGSGVDLHRFKPAQEWDASPVVLMASRLLRDKGVCEFVRAVNILNAERNEKERAEFVLVGDIDTGNPASLSVTAVEEIRRRGGLALLGYRSDMARLLSKAHVVVLPSYREGMPKILLEAAASGCAVVTTDVPGCRDAVIQGETALLVPAKDVGALAVAIESLIRDRDLRSRLGRAGRALAEQRFDVRSVVERHMAIYTMLSDSRA